MSTDDRSPRPSASSPARAGGPRWSRRSVAPVVAAALGVVWGAILYEPWRRAPFYPVDFLESINVMRAHDSLASGAWALIQTFSIGHGRLNGLAALYVTGQWALFGWDTRAWQLFAFAMMVANTIFAYHVLRRLGAGRFGAVSGAALFIPSLAVVGLWTAELHYPDPPALPFLFGAILLAAGYASTPRWAGRAVAILLLSVAAATIKETVIAALPFTLLVALCYRGDGEWGWPAINRRNVALCVGAAIVCALFALAVLAARRAAPPGDYVGHYGQGLRSVEEQLALLQSMYLPRAGTLGAGLYIGAIVLGLLVWSRRRRTTRSVMISVGVFGLLPMLGFLVYLPWYYFRPDYAAPFLIGSAALLATSAPSKLRSPAERMVAGLWCTAVLGALLLASRTAHHASRHLYATREVLGEVAAVIADADRNGELRELAFVVDTGDVQEKWFAPKVRQFASLLGDGDLPAATFRQCDQAGSDALRAGSLDVLLPGDCDSAPLSAVPAARKITRSYDFISLRGLRRQRSDVTALFWVRSSAESNSERLPATRR